MSRGRLWLRVLALLPTLFPSQLPAATVAKDAPASGNGGAGKRVITARDLITLKEIGGTNGTGLSVSPDGRYVAFELHQADPAANNYKADWFVAPIQTEGPASRVGNAGDALLFRSGDDNGRVDGAWLGVYAQWSPDSRGIAYRKLEEGQVQVWWSSRNGDEVLQLTHNAANVRDFRWDPDGSKLFFTTDAPRDDIRRAATRRYETGYVFDPVLDWSVTEGRPLYPPYELVGGAPVVWVLELSTGIERLASQPELVEYGKLIQPRESGTEDLLSSARDGRGAIRAWIAPTAEGQGGTRAFRLFGLADNEVDQVRCSASECSGAFDLSRILRQGIAFVDFDGSALFTRKTGDGYSERTLYRWQMDADQVSEVLTTDDYISDCSVVGARAICFRETPTQPREIIAIDLASGVLTTLFDPNPEFESLTIGDVELLAWSNALGHRTFGYLVTPPGYQTGRKYPLVIVGYRAHKALRGGVGNEYPVHLLAVNGFVVLVYERPTNHEAEHLNADAMDWSQANWGPELFDFRMPLESFRAVIELLSERGLVDPCKVGATGLSNGVGHVNYALIESDLFGAAITSSSDFGPSNYFLVGSSDPVFRQHRRTIGLGRYGTPEGFLWDHISLSLNAGKVQAPLLVNAADSEHPRAIEEVVVLMESGKPVDMVVYPDEGHVKWQPVHRASIYERNVDWFNFWLRDVIDPSPEKLAQYDRWRDLRRKAPKRCGAPTLR